MLKALPVECLYTGEEEFQKDFNDILNEKVEEEEEMSQDRFLCDKCKYKTLSQRALRTHKKLVHDSTFYSCKT